MVIRYCIDRCPSLTTGGKIPVVLPQLALLVVSAATVHKHAAINEVIICWVGKIIALIVGSQQCYRYGV